MPLRPLARLLIPALSLAAATTACAAQAEVGLPARPPVRSALGANAPIIDLAVPARTAVITAYLGYWSAYASALRSGSVTAATRMLSPYATAGYVRQLMISPPRVWAAHEASYGYPIPHVLGVLVRGRSAALHDCLDLSHFGTQDTRTGRLLPGTLGLAAVDMYVILTRSGAHWLVSRITRVEVPCQP